MSKKYGVDGIFGKFGDADGEVLVDATTQVMKAGTEAVTGAATKLWFIFFGFCIAPAIFCLPGCILTCVSCCLSKPARSDRHTSIYSSDGKSKT